MAEPTSNPPAPPAGGFPASGPSFAVKLIVSLLVSFHLGCILINVTAATSPMAGSPQVLQRAMLAGGFVKGYLQVLFQNNAYRFYAPNPGPCDLLWVRFKYCDPDDPHREMVAARWLETPSKDDHWMRMPYQRDLAICMLLGMQTEPMAHPQNPELGPIGVHFGDLGQICFRSFLRHLAASPRFATLTGPEFKKPLVLVGMDAFKVSHGVLTPMHVQAGFGYFDPRLYEIQYVGPFDAKGQREGVAEDVFVHQDQADLAARLIQEDLWPAADQQKLAIDDAAARADFLRRMGVPKAFRAALEEDPAFLNSKSGQSRTVLAKRFIKAVQANDDKEVLRRWGQLPPEDAPQLALPKPTASGPAPASVR